MDSSSRVSVCIIGVTVGTVVGVIIGVADGSIVGLIVGATVISEFVDGEVVKFLELFTLSDFLHPLIINSNVIIKIEIINLLLFTFIFSSYNIFRY
jgi:hypothetical protein